MTKKFDPSRWAPSLSDIFPNNSNRPMIDVDRSILSGIQFGRSLTQVYRAGQAKRVYRLAAERYDLETAEAAHKAVLAGRSPDVVFERAERLKREREGRAALVENPPPLHGSARWAAPADLGVRLRGRDAFDHPRSILLGTILDGDRAAGYLHWDDDGHLMTLAPTRTGKAVTTIVPNLLRYGGSCVVLDPKGELYEKTSRWRNSLGPVYRIAPFDDGRNPKTRSWVRHGFNPLSLIHADADARALAEMILPKDPRAQKFFTNDGVAFLSALILFLVREAPPKLRTLRSVVDMVGQSHQTFVARVVGAMAKSAIPSVRTAAENVLGKSDKPGVSNLRDTLHSELALWRDEGVLNAFDSGEVDFRALKDGTATVYIEVPFHLMEPYAPVLKVLLKAALDGMISNPTVPDIPVLFVLDEFLALKGFPEFRDAIRTHAGAGVRLWFFLQDLGTLQEQYPGTGWQAFMNCAVKQFFGTDEGFTAALISQQLSNRTLAYLSTSASHGLSTSIGRDGGSAGFNNGTSESVQFIGKPLLTPDEVLSELSGWLPGAMRNSIVQLRAPSQPIRARLVAYDKSERCVEREGALMIEGA